MNIWNVGTRCPGEIVDEIIDHLHDDKPGLFTCALVCKAWLSSSRFHLFDTICCVGELFNGTLGFDYLVKFLKEHPDIRQYIHGLGLSHHKDFGAPMSPPEERPWICEHTLAAILSMLPNLQVLEMLGVRLGGQGGACNRWHWHGFTRADIPSRFKLDSLVLLAVGDPNGSPSPLLMVLNLFEELKELFASDLYWKNTQKTVTAFTKVELPRLPNPKPMKVRTLTLRSDDHLPFLCQILRRMKPTLQSVQLVDVECSNWTEVNYVSAVIKDVGSNLSCLDLDLTSLWLQDKDGVGTHQITPQSNWKSLFFSECHSLQHIGVSLYFFPEAPLELTNSVWFEYALDIYSETPHTIMHLVLELECDGVSPATILEDMNWIRFQSILKNYKDLHKVTVDITRSPEDACADKKCEAIPVEKLEIVHRNEMLEIIFA